jgi:hypothetical protein
VTEMPKNMTVGAFTDLLQHFLGQQRISGIYDVLRLPASATPTSTFFIWCLTEAAALRSFRGLMIGSPMHENLGFPYGVSSKACTTDPIRRIPLPPPTVPLPQHLRHLDGRSVFFCSLDCSFTGHYHRPSPHGGRRCPCC